LYVNRVTLLHTSLEVIQYPLIIAPEVINNLWQINRGYRQPSEKFLLFAKVSQMFSKPSEEFVREEQTPKFAKRLPVP
jgi:hypothetical protein